MLLTRTTCDDEKLFFRGRGPPPVPSRMSWVLPEGEGCATVNPGRRAGNINGAPVWTRNRRREVRRIFSAMSLYLHVGDLQVDQSDRSDCIWCVLGVGRTRGCAAGRDGLLYVPRGDPRFSERSSDRAKQFKGSDGLRKIPQLGGPTSTTHAALSKHARPGRNIVSFDFLPRCSHPSTQRRTREYKASDLPVDAPSPDRVARRPANSRARRAGLRGRSG